MLVVMIIGTFTAIYAACIALTQNDIKRVIAYSTISSLGFMFMALGAGAWAAGIFYLFAHGFFKGLLFLASGSVIHAMSGEQDMRLMGGLRKKLPLTFWTMLVGALANAGLFPFAGFWAKDEILGGAFKGGYYVVWIVGIVTAFVTALFMFRLIFLTFYGENRASQEVQHHIHESPAVMTVPLVMLAIPAALLGLVVGLPPEGGWIHRFLEPVFFNVETEKFAWLGQGGLLMLVSLVVVVAGIYTAYVTYLRRPELPAQAAARVPWAYEASFNKFYMDEFYDTAVIRPLLAVATWLWIVRRHQGDRRRRQRHRDGCGASSAAPCGRCRPGAPRTTRSAFSAVSSCSSSLSGMSGGRKWAGTSRRASRSSRSSRTCRSSACSPSCSSARAGRSSTRSSRSRSRWPRSRWPASCCCASTRSCPACSSPRTSTWVKRFNIHYSFGVDGIAALLIFLTTLLGFIVIIASWYYVKDRERGFFVSLLLLQVGMTGVFCATDLFLFYVFWEAMLIPMYFIIGIWGGPRKIYAAIKFFLFTLVGSLLMLVAIIVAGLLRASHSAGGLTFNIQELSQLVLPYNLQFWAFLAFFLAFAIKVPMWPLHTWLPDAHVEAPTAGSVILAGVLLKMGGYGMLRFCLPMFPDAAVTFIPLVVALSIVAIIYGALVSMMQKDLKKLVAYSSVSHMGFVTLGIFVAIAVRQQPRRAWRAPSSSCSATACSRAPCSSWSASSTSARTRATSRAMGQLATPLPVLAGFFLFFTLGSLGLPGPVRVRRRVPQPAGAVPLLALDGAPSPRIGVILAACYLLWMYQRVHVQRSRRRRRSCRASRCATSARARSPRWLPLVVFAVWVGVYPNTFLNLLHVPGPADRRPRRPVARPGARRTARLASCTSPGGCSR